MHIIELILGEMTWQNDFEIPEDYNFVMKSIGDNTHRGLNID